MMNITNENNEPTIMLVRTDIGMGGNEIELTLVPVIPWDGVIADVAAETEPTHASL
jgi:hypothetical protein